MGKKKKKGGTKKKSTLTEDEQRAVDRANKKYHDLAAELQVPAGGTLWARLLTHGTPRHGSVTLCCLQAEPDICESFSGV